MKTPGFVDSQFGIWSATFATPACAQTSSLSSLGARTPGAPRAVAGITRLTDVIIRKFKALFSLSYAEVMLARSAFGR
jgi:hypothetical protein